MNRNDFKELVRQKKKKDIETLINDKGDKIINIYSSLFIKQGMDSGDYYVFNISTERYEIIKFRDIETIINNIINLPFETDTIGESMFWKIPFSYGGNDNLLVDWDIIIVSGKNTKTRGVKVINKCKIESNKYKYKTEINAYYDVIKHTENYETNLSNSIINCIKTINEEETEITNKLNTKTNDNLLLIADIFEKLVFINEEKRNKTIKIAIENMYKENPKVIFDIYSLIYNSILECEDLNKLEKDYLLETLVKLILI
jgi:hypothetical protein